MLGEVLPAEAFGFLLVSFRLVPLVLVMPVFGDSSIPGRIRGAFGFVMSIIVYTSVRGELPPMPDNVFNLITLFLREFMIGVIMGLAMRILLSAVHTAGTVIAFQTGLAAAQSFDPSQGTQGVLVAAFLSLTAITMIVVTDLHHLMIMGLVHSYVKFPVGFPIDTTSFAMVVVHYVSSAFLLGFHLASPFIAYGIVYNLGLGLVARLVPGFQVFFIGMPINIAFGFALLAILMGAMISLFLERYQDLLVSFIG